VAKDEEAVNQALADDRSPTWNTITMLWSHIGNTEYVIGVCVLVTVALLWRTRDWRWSVVPAIAISLQATIFVIATAVVGRPRPHVEHLDPAPPTSSYPSGHVGASTALYLVLALMAQRIARPWLRWVTTTVCLVLPLLVAYARLYRGMHHLTDVVVGLLNGIGCALIAYGWWRQRARSASADESSPATSAEAATT